MKKAIIRHVILLVILILGIAFWASCKTKIQYVPVESAKTEYRDKLIKDSVHILDSIFLYSRNDTIFFYKYKYIYKDKLIRDTLNVADTIQVPYEVQLPPIEKKVYPKWLVILAIIGGCALGFTGYKVIRFFV